MAVAPPANLSSDNDCAHSRPKAPSFAKATAGRLELSSLQFMTAPALVQKLWNYCNILRDHGLSYGDYVEQLTFLLFLKMADEQSRAPFNKPSPILKGFDWPALVKEDGAKLETLYRHKCPDLGDFVACYFGRDASPQASTKGAMPGRLGETSLLARHHCVETERFESITHDELIKRYHVNLDIFGLQDDGVEDSADLPATGIVADLELAREQFAAYEEYLKA